MRKIKFRAWDNESQEMLYTDYDRLKPLASFFNYVEEYENIGPEFELNIMQFTGLKGKNGKDIYEGDIVSRGLYWDIHKKEPTYFIVEYYEGAFWLKDKKGDRTNMGLACEIIGNIYENPELLNE